MLDVTRAYGLNFLYPLNDQTVGPSLRDFGEFSKVEVELATEYLTAAPDGAFIDVGANIGSVCLPLAARFPDRRFIAIEGHPGLAQVVGTNAFANGLYNVEVLHAVAGPQAKLARFPAMKLSTKGNFGSLGVKNVGSGKREANVRMCTLDEVAPEETAFVKIDVEGFEIQVLAGATKTLTTHRPVWIIETARENVEKSRQTIAIMLGHGYDVYWLFVPFVTRSGTKRDAKPKQIMGDVNIVAVPKGGANPWGLTRVERADMAHPNNLDDLPYLKRFGYSHHGWT